MAARMLSLSAAPRLWRSQEIVSTRSCGDLKQTCGVRWSGSWGAKLKVNAASRNVVVLASRKNVGPPRTGRGYSPASSAPSRKIQKSQRVENDDEDLAAEAALEALFAQLAKDLESEGEDEDDEDFTEEELAALESELEAALSAIDLDDDTEEEEKPGLVDMVMTDGTYSQATGVVQGDIQASHDEEVEKEEDEEEDVFADEEDEEEEGQRFVPLEKWQLRKLAAAAEKGRRNVNVKSLAAELGMDRSDVLSFLRSPPSELLLMSASLDSPDGGDSENLVADKSADVQRIVTPKKQPVSLPPTARSPQGLRSWHSNKRLRKEHVATFERVYRQTNRPSNAMVENLVFLTHVPRKKILQWFDDRRAQNKAKDSSFVDAPET